VAASEALARQGFVTPVDVCVGLGWLHASNVDDWRHGRVDDLEDCLPVHDYDSLLMSGASRAEARDLIRETVGRVVASWS
jgi:hypothetical protein